MKSKQVKADPDAYTPFVPDSFEAPKIVREPSALETIMGKQGAKDFRFFWWLVIWAWSGIIALAVAVALILGSARGVIYVFKTAFPPDPNAVQPLHGAPESLAETLYNQERDRLDGGLFSTNPMVEWRKADEATRNIWRQKAIDTVKQGESK
jgi:hypothetical protein